MLAIHLRDIWRLTRYCSYKIRLLGEIADAVIRLDILYKNSYQLGVTIFYQDDNAEMYKHRYIDYHYSEKHNIQIYCNLKSCECKNEEHTL